MDYDRDGKVIRSDNNLCWDIQYPDPSKENDSPSAMIARPCEQDPEKNGRFEFDAD